MKKGYKMTDLGLIPETWELCPLSEVADKSVRWSITGGPFGSNLKATDYTDDGIQIIQLQNIGDGIFYDDYIIYTSIEKADELISCNIYPGEIILSKMGDPVARACFIPAKAHRFLMASDGIRLVVNEREFSKRFVHDYINSIYFRRRAFEVSNGSTRLRIGLPQLKKLQVIKPSKAEQTAIATALNDMDNLIAGLEKLIAKKKAIKQGAMQELLRPKEGWVVKKLGAVLKVRHGKSQKEVVEEDGFYPILGSGGVIGRAKTFLYDKPSVLIGRKGTIDEPQYMELPFWSVDTLFYTEIFEGNDAKFIYYMFKLIDWYSYNEASGVPSLNAKTIEKIEKRFPKDNSEQKNISKVITDLDNGITKLEKNLEKYKLIKQGMMQELLTGKTRLI